MSTAVRRPREITYAEDTLGVHEIFTEIETVAKQLEAALESQNEFKQSLRLRDEEIEEIEYDLAVEVKAADPKLSLAAQEREVKSRLMDSHIWAQAKLSRNNKADELSSMEILVRTLELRHRTLVARMNELGGYFQYLAACKNARTSAVEIKWPY